MAELNDYSRNWPVNRRYLLPGPFAETGLLAQILVPDFCPLSGKIHIDEICHCNLPKVRKFAVASRLNV